MAHRSTRLALVALSLVADAGLSLAVAHAEAPTVRVGYADLNLASPAGQRTLARRLDNAVARVCSDSVVPGSLLGQDRCRRDVMDRAAADLRHAGVPTL